jgi:tetratricopeptide (TPR) repeat protein
MRNTSRALVLSALGVFAPAAMRAQSQSPTSQEQVADVGERDLADLQLESKVRSELEAAMGRRDYTRAETILVGEAERDPKSLQAAKLLSLAGGVFFLDGKYLNSAIAWKKAEVIAPLNEPSRFTLSMSYIKLNRRDWARKELEKLTLSAPDKPLYLYWLARLDYDAQDYTTAVTRLRKVIDLDPNMMRAYDSLGLCYDYLGKPEDAIGYYTRAIELNRKQLKPSAWPHVDLAVSLIGVNRLDDAEKNLREALGYNPKLPQAQYQLGRVLEAEGKFDAAIEALANAARLDPEYPEPHLLLGRIYHRLGKGKIAEEEIARFQQLKKSQESRATEKPASPLN